MLQIYVSQGWVTMPGIGGSLWSGMGGSVCSGIVGHYGPECPLLLRKGTKINPCNSMSYGDLLFGVVGAVVA